MYGAQRTDVYHEQQGQLNHKVIYQLNLLEYISGLALQSVGFYFRNFMNFFFFFFFECHCFITYRQIDRFACIGNIGSIVFSFCNDDDDAPENK